MTEQREYIQGELAAELEELCIKYMEENKLTFVEVVGLMEVVKIAIQATIIKENIKDLEP